MSSRLLSIVRRREKRKHRGVSGQENHSTLVYTPLQYPERKTSICLTRLLESIFNTVFKEKVNRKIPTVFICHAFNNCLFSTH